jgi:uncharacterized protein
MDRIAAGRTNPWLVFLLPFVVFMLAGSFEPTPPADANQPAAAATGWLGLGIPYSAYPLIYTVKIALTLIAVAYVWPGYRQFPLRLRPMAIGVGIVGAAVWIGLAVVQQHLVARWGWDLEAGKRSAFDPLAQLKDQPAWAFTFLAIRFVGLALVVPVIEEFFLRGFVMRFVVEADWWKVPFGTANRLAIVVGTAVPVLMHPQEALAAAVWFSAITWLMLRTRNIWDCVAAHAVTNLLLGLYVIASGNWWLM